MQDFMRIMGELSRNMLVSRGHFLMVRNLDGGAQRDHPAQKPEQTPPPPRSASAQAQEGLPGTACAR